MTKELKECLSAYEKAREELAKVVQKQIADAAKVFFDNDWLESFTWQQYTDYFNDGEECNFGVRADHDCLRINEDEEYYNFREKQPEKAALIKEISKFIFGIGDDNLYQVFGDHKEITISRDGILVEDYTDHE